MLPFLMFFIVALAIGVFIGKLLFSAKSQSEKSFLEERLNNLKEQYQIEKSDWDTKLQQVIEEKETIRNEKESINILLTKKDSSQCLASNNMVTTLIAMQYLLSLANYQK